MPPTDAQGWQGINMESRTQVEARPLRSMDIQGQMEPWTAPRTVTQVLASDNYDPWDPIARSPEETSPGEAKDSLTERAQQDHGTDRDAEVDAHFPMEPGKETNKMSRDDRWRPCEAGPPPHLAGLWIPPGRTLCPPPGLVPTMADPWGIDINGPPDIPAKRPQQEWQSFLQACAFCGKEIRTITQGGQVGQDCYQCGKVSSLAPKTLIGSNYAAHFNIGPELDALVSEGAPPAPGQEEFPLKVLCMACQVSGTISVKENFIGTDCGWCGKRNSLAYLDPGTLDPHNDPQPLMPSGALTALSQPPAYIFKIQASLGDFDECPRCHRHLRKGYRHCLRCQTPQCTTHSCTFLHNQWCGGSFGVEESPPTPGAWGGGNRTTGRWAWALWPVENRISERAQLAQAGSGRASEIAS